MSARPLVNILLVAALVAGVVAVWQAWARTPTAGAPGQEGWVSTPWGPLGPADRDLLIRVRLAGLWEHPTGQEMSVRASNGKVRDIAGQMSREHLELDEIVSDVANRLGVLLPNQPTTEQQAWMYQITKENGANYDWTAVNLLRQAHGTILPAIYQVRVGTRNELIRPFADKAAQFVGRHIAYLESTGLVDFARLDEPPTPPRAVVTSGGQYENVPVALLALAALVVLAGLAAVTTRQLSQRRRAPPVHRSGGTP